MSTIFTVRTPRVPLRILAGNSHSCIQISITSPACRAAPEATTCIDPTPVPRTAARTGTDGAPPATDDFVLSTVKRRLRLGLFRIVKSVRAHVLHEKTNSFSFTTSTGLTRKQLLIHSLGIHRSNPDADAGATVQEQLWIPPDDAMPPILTSLLLLSNKSKRKGRPFFLSEEWECTRRAGLPPSFLGTTNRGLGRGEEPTSRAYSLFLPPVLPPAVQPQRPERGRLPLFFLPEHPPYVSCTFFQFLPFRFVHSLSFLPPRPPRSGRSNPSPLSFSFCLYVWFWNRCLLLLHITPVF